MHLNNVRVAFPVFFEPKTFDGKGEAKFSGTFLFPRDHPQLGEIESGMVAAAKAKWGEKADEVLKSLKAGDRLAAHDGDAKSQYDGFAGNYYVNASNKIRPLVIGLKREPLVAADGKPYSGSYVNVIIEFWAQDNQYGKRINASLMGVQFAKDGERLAGGGVAAADDFEDISGEEREAATESGGGASGLF